MRCEPALREKAHGSKRGKVELRAALESTTASVVSDPSPWLL